MSSSKTSGTKYTICLEKKSAWYGWHQLKEQCPAAMERCQEFLANSPTATIKSRGKAKRLKGKLKWLIQYDITDGDRIRYWVDKEKREVKVEYAGPHP